MPDKRTLIITTGPALMPYFKPLSQEFDLVVTTKDQAKNVTAQFGVQNVRNLTDWYPQVAPDNILQKCLLPVAYIDWDSAYERFRWPGWTCIPEEWLMGFTARMLSEIVPLIGALDRLLAEKKVAGVVVHEDLTPHMAYVVEWARSRGIPSVHVAHGSYGSAAYKGQGLPDEYNVHSFLWADTMCVWNEMQRDFMIANGAPPERVILTGCGNEDRWFNIPKDGRAAKMKFGFDEHDKVCLMLGTFAQHMSADTTTDWIDEHVRLFLQAAKDMPGWRFILNAHPGRHKWTAAWHAEQMRAAGVHGIATEDHIEMCVQACDVIFDVAGSQAGVEAGILNRASVQFVHSGEWGKPKPEFYTYAEKTPESIREAILRAVDRPKTQEWQEARNKAVYDMMWIPDGKATERVLAVIREKFAEPK